MKTANGTDNVVHITHKFLTEHYQNFEMEIGIKKFYYCHRSCSLIKKGNNTREIKSTRRNKIGTVCPSMLEVIEKDWTAGVKF